MHAACSASHQAVAVLVESGAAVEPKNGNGSTALHMAVGHGASVETIELLLRSGAAGQIGTANEFGYTPLRMAIEKGRDEIVQILKNSA